jgi:hypothetical protein
MIKILKVFGKPNTIEVVSIIVKCIGSKVKIQMISLYQMMVIEAWKMMKMALEELKLLPPVKAEKK